MSNEPDETSTDPIAQRIVLANEAVAILNKSRRPSPFTGLTPLLADEIIALAEYLRLGDASFIETDAEPGEFVDPMTLRVGDVIQDYEGLDVSHVVIDRPTFGRISGEVAAKIRPMPGGTARLTRWPVGSTVRLISRAPESEAQEWDRVFVGDLKIDDVILDFGDGAIEAEKVIRLRRPEVGLVVEVTTVDPRLDEEIQAAVTRGVPVDHQIIVRLPRP